MFVQDVIAAMTTDPWRILYSTSSYAKVAQAVRFSSLMPYPLKPGCNVNVNYFNKPKINEISAIPDLLGS